MFVHDRRLVVFSYIAFYISTVTSSLDFGQFNRELNSKTFDIVIKIWWILPFVHFVSSSNRFFSSAIHFIFGFPFYFGAFSLVCVTFCNVQCDSTFQSTHVYGGSSIFSKATYHTQKCAIIMINKRFCFPPFIFFFLTNFLLLRKEAKQVKNKGEEKHWQKKFEARFITRIEFSLLIYLLANCFGIRLRWYISMCTLCMSTCLPYTCGGAKAFFNTIILSSYYFVLGCTEHIAHFVGLWTGFLPFFLFVSKNCFQFNSVFGIFKRNTIEPPFVLHSINGIFFQAIRFVFSVWCSFLVVRTPEINPVVVFFVLSYCQNSWKSLFENHFENGKWKMDKIKLHFSFLG